MRADLWTDFEAVVGQLGATEMEATTGRVKAPALTQWVNAIGDRLAAQSTRPGLCYRFAILDTYEQNAFALPGGYVYVTLGLLQHLNSDEELAGVLAHELAHSTDRDFARYLRLQLVYLGVQAALRKGDKDNWVPAAQIVQTLDSLRHSRRYEGQADRNGLALAFQAGFDPAGLVEFLATIGDEANRLERLFATHPPGPERVKAANQRLAELRRADYHATLEIAQQAEQSGHLSRAAATYRAATQLWPDDPEPWLRLAAVQERRGLVKAARAAYQAVLNRDGSNEAARFGQENLTRTGQAPLVTVALPEAAQASVRATRESWQAAEAAQGAAARRLYGVLRQFDTDSQIANGLQAAQVIAPESNEPRYLAALGSAYLALQKAERTDRLIGEVYRQGLALRSQGPQVGATLLEPAKVPEPAAANREAMALAAARYAERSGAALAVGNEVFDAGSRAGRDLLSGTRLVAAAFLALLGTGSNQPLGRLTAARFILLEGDIAYGARLLVRAQAQGEEALSRALAQTLVLSGCSLDVAEARASGAQRALYRQLVAQRLGLAAEAWPEGQSLGEAATARVAERVPAAGLAGLQARACLLRMCERDVAAERVESEAF